MFEKKRTAVYSSLTPPAYPRSSLPLSSSLLSSLFISPLSLSRTILKTRFSSIAPLVVAILTKSAPLLLVLLTFTLVVSAVIFSSFSISYLNAEASTRFSKLIDTNHSILGC
ncbi:unnamed protein product [Lactuca virosa]|uniref:Transmembrane protein n=1 Tax=Lactuca virosa TaxID=75947 RepID=A0AAU9NMZ2_9ASTR|nr:unnamed protein product [Lactuca virosa]